MPIINDPELPIAPLEMAGPGVDAVANRKEPGSRHDLEGYVDRSGKCQWCKKEAESLVRTRDYDEGLYGPHYYVCQPCYDRQQAKLREELDRYPPDDEYYD